MGLRKLLKTLESRYAWSVIGVVIGVVGLYAAFHQRHPRVDMEIVAESNIIDVYRALPDLSVVFQGQDIQSAGLNLRLVRIRVGNSGEADILQNYYDTSEAWGLVVDSGRLLEARVVDASQQYLTRAVSARIAADSILLSKPILEKDQFFYLELLVLHPRADKPHFSPTGKIAGVPPFSVVDRATQTRSEGLWRELTHGSVLVHILRFVGYIIGLALLTTVMALTGSAIQNAGARRRRKARQSQIALLRQSPADEPDAHVDVITEFYTEGGLPALKGMEQLLNEPSELEVETRLYLLGRRRPLVGLQPHSPEIQFATIPSFEPGHPYFEYTVINRLIEKGLLDSKKHPPEVVPKFRSSLGHYVAKLGDHAT